MALVLKDRVRETSISTGTGTINILGAVTGYQTFGSAIGSGNTCYYTIYNQGTNEWEVGLGTVGSGTLSRDTVLSSSNSGSLVNFSAGTKDVFVTYPAEKAVYEDASDIVELLGSLDVAGNTTLGSDGTDTITLNGTVQPGVVVSGSSSGDAFRITQTGTGNAFVVEDSTSPDASPFVINASGNVGIGVIVPAAKLDVYGIGAGADILQSNNSSSAGTGATFAQRRDRAGGLVNSGDTVGIHSMSGYDGTNFIEAARIIAQVDGTPSTNDMPGRLVFSTTADGASSPTERLRIDSLGRIGAASIFGTTAFNLRNNMLNSGQTTNYGFRSAIIADIAATASIVGFATTSLSGGAGGSAYTTTNLVHYQADTFTLGANQTVTNQFGFNVGTGLTNATNNYGFYSNIASGTGRWNFYANGSAANYFAGNVGIGTSSPVAQVEIVNSSTGRAWSATTTTELLVERNGSASVSIVASNSASSIIYFSDTDAESRGLLGYDHSSDAMQFRTANTERMRIDSSGNVGIGVAPYDSNVGLVVYRSQNSLLYQDVQNPNTGSSAGAIFRLISSNAAGSGTTSADFVKYKTGGLIINNNETNSAAYTSFGVGASERMRIDSSGNVGIGTSSPTGKLDVNGKLVLSGGEDNQLQWTNNSQTWRINNSTGGQLYIYDVTGAKFPFKISAGASSDSFVINSSGNVGIGTSSPQARLHVKPTTNVNIYGTNNGSAFQWTAINDAQSAYVDLITNALTQQFQTGGTERMRIHSSGNVSIGTSTAGINDCRLKVSGTMAGGFATASTLLTNLNFAQSGNVIQKSIGSSQTFAVPLSPEAGAICVLQIVKTNSTNAVITFGSGFLAAGTLTTGTDSTKRFNVIFASNGTNLVEIARNGPM